MDWNKWWNKPENLKTRVHFFIIYQTREYCNKPQNHKLLVSFFKMFHCSAYWHLLSHWYRFRYLCWNTGIKASSSVVYLLRLSRRQNDTSHMSCNMSLTIKQAMGWFHHGLVMIWVRLRDDDFHGGDDCDQNLPDSSSESDDTQALISFTPQSWSLCFSNQR